MTPLRLRLIFVSVLDDPLDALTPPMCRHLYRKLAEGVSARTGRPYSTDTHRNCLSVARSFAKWCVARKWLRSNPFDGIEGEGMRTKGKVQLRIDEARAWTGEALRLARGGDEGAVAALLALLLGLRAGEIVSRSVRDVDDDGRLLWIDVSARGRWKPKTDAGRRTVEIPAMIRPHLARLCKGKEGGDLLFADLSRYSVRRAVHRVCQAAGVPKVCAHAMRGLPSTLAVEAGATGHLVAASLGQTSFAVTEAHYVAPGTVARAKGRRALQVLKGGRK